MPEVFVAVGGNIEPRRRLRQALALLSAAYPDIRISPAYANRAVGFEGEDFVNLVVGFHTDEPLAQVLETLHGIEAACGRPREAARWAPRAMDLDVLLYGSDTGAYPEAVLPRPDLLKRAFMLGPLADLAPDLVHPVAGVTMAELWRRFDRAAHELRPIEL